ncbi:Hypothetical predicted protein [Mytilus galloprovincialis]|uniref:Uncharacterized protein n=1 Tax=Mytilus galloprovincialis TaxID=29158 RepID=A0A8B6H5P7_MYTGA|nr:Hypothetical predicted protein [Mytilus galloprovincialis]
MINKEFDNQESRIKKKIQETREKINQRLDILEQQLIQNLSTKTAVCKSGYDNMLIQLNLADQKLSQIKVETETLKQMASDIQVFLGTREIDKNVSEEIKSIKGVINSATCFNIEIDIETAVSSILNSTYQFGIVSLAERKI